jgi:mRNA interferase RelE/StbE
VGKGKEEARPLRHEAYRIEIRRKATKALAQLPKADQRRIAYDIDLLAADPRPAGQAKQLDKDIYRVRTGNYRSIYQVNDADRLVLVLVIGHRRFVYDAYGRGDR